MVTLWWVTDALGAGLSASAFLSASFASSAARRAGAPSARKSARASAGGAKGRTVDLIPAGSSSEAGGLQPPHDRRGEGDAMVEERVVSGHVDLGDVRVPRPPEPLGEGMAVGRAAVIGV